MRRGACALIVDAPSPVGAAASLRLARDGWPVVLHYSDDDASAERLAMEIEESGGRAATLHARFTTQEGTDGLFEEIEHRWGPVLVLVAGTAGIARGPRSARSSSRAAAETALVQGIQLVHRALEPMRAARFGRVVQVTSCAAGLGDRSRAPARLARFATAIAPGLARHGITVNTVAAGIVDTSRRGFARESLKHVPARRAGTPEEIAGCVRFLVSPDASYVTGHVLFVDGGMRASRLAGDPLAELPLPRQRAPALATEIDSALR